ncbi:hypothetical protein GUJ93_ZPchr0013g35799 [Zizania palustris]|uniref:Peptidase C1A papain C-terminal domain-containing protein n=1 Tax=Zizania palustris TaxID=103762 RepID=A0A8J5X129_ZIZPA|nr:hypothetical protein GUJ93_ZPchr0013g35799 [Zizania palustris]
MAVSDRSVVVLVNSIDLAFKQYSGGLSMGAYGTNITHGMVGVGNNTTDFGEPFWILRNSWGHDSCIFPGSKLWRNVTKSGGENTTMAQTSDAEGSAIWRLRTGRETRFVLLLRWLSLMVVVMTTNSNFWT